MDAFKDLHSEETERAALGCMFLDRSAAALGKTMLLAEDFYTPMYRVIFEAMQGVEEIDAVTVMNELARRGEAERIGIDRIAGITHEISTSVYLRSYIDDLKRLADDFCRRGTCNRAMPEPRVVRTAQEMAQAAYRQDIGGIDRSMAAMRGDGWGSAEIVTLADATEKHIREIAALRESGKKIVGLPTGFTDLDLMLGGLRNGDFCILAARPSMGKSALALDIAKHAQKSMTEQADRVVFFSLEMPDKSLGNRGYTSEFLIDNDRFAVGANDAAWQETLRGVAENRADYESGAGRLIIRDETGQTVEKMSAFLHGLQGQGIRPRFIVVDYLQLIVSKGQDRVREVGNISRGLKQMAKDWDCPVLALSQLSRGPEGRADHRPILSDLRDSGDIEQDADVILFLYRDEYYYPDTEKKNTAELNIAKQRNGPTGTIALTWMPRSTTFRSAAGFHETKEAPPKEWVQEHL